MLYGFSPVHERRVLDAAPVLYRRPEKHPTRLLDFHDIFYMVEGHWAVMLEGEEILLQAGDIAMLPTGFRHRGHQDCTADTRAIYIHFAAEKEDKPFKAGAETEILPVYSRTHAENFRSEDFRIEDSRIPF